MIRISLFSWHVADALNLRADTILGRTAMRVGTIKLILLIMAYLLLPPPQFLFANDNCKTFFEQLWERHKIADSFTVAYGALDLRQSNLPYLKPLKQSLKSIIVECAFIKSNGGAEYVLPLEAHQDLIIDVLNSDRLLSDDEADELQKMLWQLWANIEETKRMAM